MLWGFMVQLTKTTTALLYIPGQSKPPEDLLFFILSLGIKSTTPKVVLKRLHFVPETHDAAQASDPLVLRICKH
jgi:hypothetical protein